MVLRSFSFLILIFSIVLFSGCKQLDLFEKNTIIPKQAWKKDFPCSGTFTITDTSAYYQMYIVLRHTDAYAYNNIWLNVGLQSPKDTMYFQKVNFTLGDDNRGWYGSGMDDIWEIRSLLTNKPRKFIKPGEYKFEIYQIMRNNPLKNVLNAGMRVEKVKNR